MNLKKWNFNQSSEPTTQILANLVNKQGWLPLIWSEMGNKKKQVRLLLSQFDLTIVELAGGAFGFVLPISAWPTFTQRVRKQFADDQQILADLVNLEVTIAVYWQAGRFHFNLTKHPLIYGILNITPDSFYDGGRFNSHSAMVKQIEKMVAAGADIIEPGGQTTKPGHFVEVTPEEEWRRIAPAIELIQDRYPQVAIAVDTYKLPVMERALAAGVDIINDVNGFETAEKRQLLAKYSKVGLVTMHSSRGHEYENLTNGMKKFFKANLAELTAAGIDRERICLDQGIGYAKVADGYQDFAMMNNLAELNEFHRPIMVAISRKGFGQKLFGLPKEKRLGVTLIAETAMFLAGGRVLRVHDVEETQQLVKLIETIKSSYWSLPGHYEEKN